MLSSTSGPLHTRSSQLARSNERPKRSKRWWWLAVTDVVFRVVDGILEAVSGFQYLGRYLSGDDNDELAIEWYIRKARKKWG
jgi:hypothetical protein